MVGGRNLLVFMSLPKDWINLTFLIWKHFSQQYLYDNTIGSVLSIRKDRLKMYLPQNCFLCAKRKRGVVKFVAPPKEMLLSFSFVQFLTNYDVTNRKQQMELLNSFLQKWHKESQSYYNRDYLCRHLKYTNRSELGVSCAS